MDLDYMESFADWYNNNGGDDLSLSAIEETWSPESVPNKRTNKVELFLGRLQPVHLGHVKIIKKMKNPIVVLVKGAKSSQDKNRNPLSAEEQRKLLKKAVPRVKVVVAKAGYLPEIIADLREAGYEVETVYAGSDRISSYKRQVDSANKKLLDKQKFDVTFRETERFASATEVRNAIRSDDKDEFQKLMPKELWSEFDHLKELMK